MNMPGFQPNTGTVGERKRWLQSGERTIAAMCCGEDMKNEKCRACDFGP
jgi:hypothetical protein